ncbi:AfsR/SARP family transcriptional regulator [Streptomyces shenzhenensis]|uniref:AfsR/SARP family transcriptional regulator n=1 Tax=Streptomyces shenzhenensis TaxID=943815 RepID=UPI001F1AB244|nr:BTAD domain-containing putative transcriptional regulator [Streptomyces shenzhenensis]
MWLTVLGPLRAWQDEVELDLGPAKRQALLALLLVRTGQPTSLATIIDVLWGQDPPSSAANVVYRHTAAIRRLLETGDQGPGRPSARLVRVSGGYRLDAGPATLDLLSFRQLTGQARRLAEMGAMRESVRLFTRALRLSRGPIASGILSHVAQHPYFVAVDGEYLTAVKEAAVIAGRLGELGAVLDVLQPAAVQHPLDETLQAQLMRTLAAAGRQAEALQAYHAVRTHLDEQLGIVPGPELRSVYEDILLRGTQGTEPGAAGPASPTCHPSLDSLCPLAGHRERGCPAPWPSGPLPPEAAGFVGREAELARLAALVPADQGAEGDAVPIGGEVPGGDTTPNRGEVPSGDTTPNRGEVPSGDTTPDGGEMPGGDAVPGAGSGSAPAGRDVGGGAMGPRVLGVPLPTPVAAGEDAAAGLPPVASPVAAVVGPPGIGKTALVVRAAHRLGARFPDGLLFVDLRGHARSGDSVTAKEALRGLLVALGTPGHRVPAGLRERSALYRDLLSDRRVLVVLDDARDAGQVRNLLPRSPGCLTLVTSRDPLDDLVVREGARRLEPDALEPAQAYEALACQVGAARAAAEPEGAAALAAYCAGVPLALALAGAVAVRRPDDGLDTLAEELRAHGAPPGGTPDPPETVRRVLLWSYARLPAETARMFRLLALHPGRDVPVSAAASLAGVAPVRARAMLDELSRARLLSAQDTDTYLLHDLLRTCALRLSHVHDPDDMRRLAVRRMLDHYVHTAREAGYRLAPHRNALGALPAPQPRTTPERLDDPAQAADWLDRRLLPVLSGVLREAVALGLHAHVHQLGLALELPLDRWARWDEQLALQQTCLFTAGLQADLVARAQAHRALGFSYGRLGRHTDAQTHLHSALNLFAEAEDEQGQARVHRCIALLANVAGRHDLALSHYQQALDLYRRASDTSGEADVRNEIGWTRLMRGDHTAALDPCARAAGLCRAADRTAGGAIAYDGLGHARHRLGA